PGATLSFPTRWGLVNDHEIDVWWVDLSIKTGPDTTYRYRIRDRKLRCRPLGTRVRPEGAELPIPKALKGRTLAEAVEEFNRRAQNNPTGKTQPPLTEDEVVAAIRGRPGRPAPDDVHKAYRAIADNKTLPAGATLSFIPCSALFRSVWWVDLSIMTGPDTGFSVRIRKQTLRCRPVGEFR